MYTWTAPNGLSVTQGQVKMGMSKEVTRVEIPNGVEVIDDCAFREYQNLEYISLPDSIRRIADSAFVDCYSLRAITIPKKVTQIECYVFQGCRGLRSVTMHQGIKSIGEKAFAGCTSLDCVTLPDGITNIGRYAFEGCQGLQSIELPKDIKNIMAYTFGGCISLYRIVIPSQVKNILDGAFIWCTSLSQVNMPDGLQGIHYRAFYGCGSLKEIILPENLRELGCAYVGCPLTDVILPDALYESHKDSVFRDAYCVSYGQLKSFNTEGKYWLREKKSLYRLRTDIEFKEIAVRSLKKCAVIDVLDANEYSEKSHPAPRSLQREAALQVLNRLVHKKSVQALPENILSYCRLRDLIGLQSVCRGESLNGYSLFQTVIEESRSSEESYSRCSIS